MHYFIFPDIDTTLYEQSGSQNTGLDEILEVRKDLNDAGSNPKVSRALLKFDLTYISQSVSSGLIASDAKYYLNLYDANPAELSTSQSLYAYPISGSWVHEGEGFKADDPITTDGASWYYRDNADTKTYWTGSITGSGGTWHTDVYGSQSLEYETRDVRMDVTPIVTAWFNGTHPNSGFILKRSGSIGNSDSNAPEGNDTRLGNLSFFSRQTNTIYPPKLEVEWYDTAWSTGSLSALSKADIEDLQIYM